jgi:hypothetical protein
LWPNHVEGLSVIELIRNNLVCSLVMILQQSVLYNGHKICSELGNWISVFRWPIKSTPKHVAGVDAVIILSMWRKE